MNKISTKRINCQKNIENDNIRDKIKFIIKKDKKYNLRDLSRTLKKNDAYLFSLRIDKYSKKNFF